MNKFYLVLGFLITFNISPAYCENSNLPDWKIKARQFVEKLAGEKWAIKFFGTKEIIYELPAIPYVDENAKSTDIYKNKYEEKIVLDKDQNLRLNIAFVSELFEVIKERKGSGSEVGNWINVMDQGGSREGVYRAMVLDGDYQGMENFDRPITKLGAEFAHDFSKRFSGLEIKKETLGRVNFYSVKRLVTEKALEIVDAFKEQEDLHKWYAIMSIEMAKKYKYAFTNDVRKNINFEYHLNWATQVPRQHLKSEIIIKLHQVFNSLQKVE